MSNTEDSIILDSIAKWLARDVAPPEGLLVPAHYGASGATWDAIDWLGVAFWYLSGAAERAFEARNGPIHSYSVRLVRWNPQFWERAWVNRIALFLRRWGCILKRSNPRCCCLTPLCWKVVACPCPCRSRLSRPMA